MRMAAIVLAAGRSRRFGAGNKLMADLAGRPMLAYALAAVAATPFDDIVVVTGERENDIRRLGEAAGARAIFCAQPGDGPGLTIATGIGALAAPIDGALILPGDMPLITADGLRRLTAAFCASGGTRIVYAATPDCAQRNPVLWPRASFEALMRLDGSGGGKVLIAHARPEALAVPASDPLELIDVDDAADLAMAADVLRARSGLR